jgi:hypothetical protein
MNAERAKEYAEQGFTVLRGLLSADELAELTKPILAAYTSHDYEASAAYDVPAGQESARYPAPGNHCLGSRLLAAAPQVMRASADHPAVVAAVEELLGDQAVLSQYQVYMRTPARAAPARAAASGAAAARTTTTSRGGRWARSCSGCSRSSR